MNSNLSAKFYEPYFLNDEALRLGVGIGELYLSIAGNFDAICFAVCNGY